MELDKESKALLQNLTLIRPRKMKLKQENKSCWTIKFLFDKKAIVPLVESGVVVNFVMMLHELLPSVTEVNLASSDSLVTHNDI